jgi:hypothetical protein
VSRVSIDWDRVRRRHAPELVDIATELFSAGGPFQISAETMACDTKRPAKEAECLLLDLCPPLDKVPVLSCPNCDTPLGDSEYRLETCPACGEQYAEHGGVQVSRIFAYHAARSRNVIWVLALHGMNTRGTWQEEFSWRVSTSYSRSVPVAIYKYGLVRPGAIWHPSLRRKVGSITAKIRKLQGDTHENGFAGPPDIIAHSLGTWLIGHALQWNPTLRIGRLVLLGSILRPDFDWARLIARGQVDAVLNHYSSEDFWARVAHYIIPDSGPSGRCGFDLKAPVMQVRADGLGHSEFFLEDNLAKIFETVWRPFLMSPTQELLISAIGPEIKWRQAPWICRATVFPLTLLAVYWAGLGGLICCCVLGAWEAVRLWGG